MTLSNRELVMLSLLGEMLDRWSGDNIAYELLSCKPLAGVDRVALLKAFGVDWDALAPGWVNARVTPANAPSLVGDEGDKRQAWVDYVDVFDSRIALIGTVEVEQSDERAPYESAVLGLLQELWPGCNPRIKWC